MRLMPALMSMRRTFALAVLIFCVSIYVGYTSDSFRQFLDQQIAGLGQMAQEISALENADFMFFLVIFLNNAIKSVIVMFAGLLFGIIPLFFLVVNGMMIGYLVRLLNENALLTEFSVWEVIVRGLLPHGIIEIPIILLAAAYGLRLGWAMLMKLIHALSGRRDEVSPALGELLRRGGSIALFVTAMLFVAALIEAYITPLLLAP